MATCGKAAEDDLLLEDVLMHEELAHYQKCFAQAGNLLALTALGLP